MLPLKLRQKQKSYVLPTSRPLATAVAEVARQVCGTIISLLSSVCLRADVLLPLRIRPFDHLSSTKTISRVLFIINLESDRPDMQMKMWKPLLVSITLDLVISLSAALNLSQLPNTKFALAPINVTSPAPEAPGGTTNLTYSPWPEPPYSIPLLDTGLPFLELYLIIGAAAKFETSPVISVLELCHFLQDFSDNIQREYPAPGFVPRHAAQSTIDVSSYTRWRIVVCEGPFGGRVPTAAVLVAFDLLGKLLRRYGPSEIVWSIEKVGVRTPWAYGRLYIDKIRGLSLNKSSSNENSYFRTT